MKLNGLIAKIITGIVSVSGIVFLVQWLSGFLFPAAAENAGLFSLAIAVVQCVMAVWMYILVCRYFEKRPIVELSGASFLRNAIPGFLTGIVLQALIILILYFAGGYIINRINPVSFMLPAFTAAITAGFVAEIIIRGILFRLLEEKLGTVVAICFMIVLFIIIHSVSKNASVLSVMAVSMQAGFLLSAAYVFTRNLWFPIFLHFAWDFAEPGIFGAINPGNTIEKSLFTCQVSGPYLLTGGDMGPVNSLQSLLVCLMAGSFILWLARQRKRFIFPAWKKTKG